MSTTTTENDGLGDITLADGPWDFADVANPDDFLDFGPLKLPNIPGLQATLEIDKRSKRIGAVSVKVNDCLVQLQVLAAPRGTGAWTDTRRKLGRALAAKPGHQQAMEGHFGPETLATLTGCDRKGQLADVTVRYVGIDGSRWTLKAMIMGPSVTTDATVERVNALLSHCAVDRGDAPFTAGSVMVLAPAPGTLAADAPQVETDANPTDEVESA